MTTKQKTLLKEKEVLGEFDKNNYKENCKVSLTC